MDTTYFETFLRTVESCPDKREILGDEELILPPSPDYGYDSTPRNALTFAAMGVDGVHYAILKINGAIGDDSPVVHVGPMDFSEPYLVVGDSFINYLATACGITAREMEAVFQAERAGQGRLVPFLKQHFVPARLYDETRLRKLAPFLDLIEPKS